MDTESFKKLIIDNLGLVYGLKLSPEEIDDIANRIIDSYEFGYEIGFCEGCESRKENCKS